MEYQRIRTPYLYPDGEVIDVFYNPQDDKGVVSDLGETTRWMSTVHSRVSKPLIKDVRSLISDVEFREGILLTRCRQGEDYNAAAVRVAKAAVRVSHFGSLTRYDQNRFRWMQGAKKEIERINLSFWYLDWLESMKRFHRNYFQKGNSSVSIKKGGTYGDKN